MKHARTDFQLKSSCFSLDMNVGESLRIWSLTNYRLYGLFWLVEQVRLVRTCNHCANLAEVKRNPFRHMVCVEACKGIMCVGLFCSRVSVWLRVPKIHTNKQTHTHTHTTHPWAIVCALSPARNRFLAWSPIASSTWPRICLFHDMCTYSSKFVPISKLGSLCLAPAKSLRMSSPEPRRWLQNQTADGNPTTRPSVYRPGETEFAWSKTTLFLHHRIFPASLYRPGSARKCRIWSCAQVV